MTVSLVAAMEAADRRKLAVFGEDTPPGLAFTDTDIQTRSMFLGFEVDTNEVQESSVRIAYFFLHMAGQVGLRALFSSCWIDGLLTGLLAAQQLTPPPQTPGEGTDALTGGAG